MAVISVPLLAGKAQPQDHQQAASFSLKRTKEQAVAIGQHQPLEPAVATQSTTESKAAGTKIGGNPMIISPNRKNPSQPLLIARPMADVASRASPCCKP